MARNAERGVVGADPALDGADRQQPSPVARDVRLVRLAGQDPLQAGGDVGVVVETEHGVRLGEALGQVGAVALGQAADGDHLLGAPLLLEVGRLEQRVDGVLLGLLDEPAGVDHHRVGGRRVLDEEEAARRETSGQLLGVDLVAGTAQGHERDGRGHRTFEYAAWVTGCRNRALPLGQR
jgi:hypothetical protein